MPEAMNKGARDMSVFGMVTQATFLAVQVVLMVSHGIRTSNILFSVVCIGGFVLFAAVYIRKNDRPSWPRRRTTCTKTATQNKSEYIDEIIKKCETNG